MDERMRTPIYAEYAHRASPCLLLEEPSSVEVFLGYNFGELEGKSFFDLIDPSLADDISAQMLASIENSGEVETILPMITKSGARISVFARGVKEDDSVRGVIVRCKRINELIESDAEQIEAYREKLSNMTVRAEKDSLTGLLNAGTTRRLGEEYLAEGEKNCALIVIDVDDFKQINDRYGHMVGDRVMCCAAYTIKKLFRAGDIVGRVGGDEFLVLMKDISDRAIAELRCSQIVKAFSDIECDQMEGHTLSCSVGASLAPYHGNGYETLFCRADSAMYRAKKTGGNKFIIED